MMHFEFNLYRARFGFYDHEWVVDGSQSHLEKFYTDTDTVIAKNIHDPQPDKEKWEFIGTIGYKKIETETKGGS